MKTAQAMFQPCPKCGHIKNPHSKTCGQCAGKGHKARSPLVLCICRSCGNEFDMPAWRVKQGRGLFCSRPCVNAALATVSGPAHHKYTGRNTPAKYVGTNWHEAKQAVLARAQGHCEWCDVDLSTVKRYAVHHVIGPEKFAAIDEAHTPDNLSVICQSCHAKHHGLGKMPPKEVMPYG